MTAQRFPQKKPCADRFDRRKAAKAQIFDIASTA
jgi:hypothetical protein